MIKLLLLTFVLMSCASKRDIVSADKNSLLIESFYRYDFNQEKIEEKGLAKCIAKQDVNLMSKDVKTINTNLKNFFYWIKQSNCYMYNNDFSKAYYFLMISKSYQKSNIDKAIFNNNMGAYYLAMKRFSKANSHFKTSLKYHEYITPRYNLTILNNFLNKQDKVKLHAKYLNPNDPILKELGR
ncbi:MAG: hypothetical protein N4A33_05505 [Bacteriovoracaceae bacterium]|jgi:hypothetical protein|nr:hypothetical protein [Bacteriovoracaceae bacterium]